MDDNRSTVALTIRALEHIGLAGAFALLAAFAGLGKIAWSSWNGSESSLSLCNWTIGLAAVGIVAELVDAFWQRSRALVVLAVAMATLFYIREHETWAAALAGLSQQWANADGWSWAIALFAICPLPSIALAGLLEKEAAWDERRATQAST